MRIRNHNYENWIIYSILGATIMMFVCFFIMLFLGKYGVKGLYEDLVSGILAICLGVMMLGLCIVFLSEAVKRIRKKSVDYKAYFIGLILLIRSIVIAIVLMIFVAVVVRFAKNSVEKALYMIISVAVAGGTFFAYIKYCKKHKSMQKNVLAILCAVVMLPTITCIGFYAGTKNIYNSASDIITRNTCGIVLTDVTVTKRTKSKGGTSYTLKGYDRNANKHTSFDITHGTYYKMKDNNVSAVKIVFYEKSRVISSISIADEMFLNDYIDLNEKIK